VTQADLIDVDEEVAGITAVLGRPTGDTGWLPMPTEQLPCKRDAQHREVVWNDLRLSFERGFEGANLGAWNLPIVKRWKRHWNCSSLSNGH
jgi:hypothetical protein